MKIKMILIYFLSLGLSGTVFSIRDNINHVRVSSLLNIGLMILGLILFSTAIAVYNEIVRRE